MPMNVICWRESDLAIKYLQFSSRGAWNLNRQRTIDEGWDFMEVSTKDMGKEQRQEIRSVKELITTNGDLAIELRDEKRKECIDRLKIKTSARGRR